MDNFIMAAWQDNGKRIRTLIAIMQSWSVFETLVSTVWQQTSGREKKSRRAEFTIRVKWFWHVAGSIRSHERSNIRENFFTASDATSCLAENQVTVSKHISEKRIHHERCLGYHCISAKIFAKCIPVRCKTTIKRWKILQENLIFRLFAM